MNSHTLPIQFQVSGGVGQADLFGLGGIGGQWPGVAITDQVKQALSVQAPVFISVSGGKDSQALAYRVSEHLDAVGHVGARMLIHSDLGRVEWRDSLPVCERLARRLDLELIVARRRAGDMMDRWLTRWSGNVRRYSNLECVKLIMPWSSPTTRFCTSELKSAVLASAMRKRFPTGDLVSAVGIRRQESSARAKACAWAPDARTTRKQSPGHTWNPLLDWSVEDVISYIHERGDELHEAYRTYRSTRVSCAFCIMGSLGDLEASAACVDNQAIYREMVDLEIESTYGFQSNRWLGDVAPMLLDADTRARLHEAKDRASARQAAELDLPKHLLFAKGWPTAMPTGAEAHLIASVRRRVAAAIGFDIDFTDAESVLQRYSDLMAQSAIKACAQRHTLDTTIEED